MYRLRELRRQSWYWRTCVRPNRDHTFCCNGCDARFEVTPTTFMVRCRILCVAWHVDEAHHYPTYVAVDQMHRRKCLAEKPLLLTRARHLEKGHEVPKKFSLPE